MIPVRSITKQLKAGSTVPGNITHFSGNALDLTLVLPAGQTFDGAEAVYYELHDSKTSDPDDVITDSIVENPTGDSVTFNLSSAHMNPGFNGPIGGFWIVVIVIWPSASPERGETIWTANLLLQRHNASLTTPAPPAPVLRLTKTAADLLYPSIEIFNDLAIQVANGTGVASVNNRNGAVTLDKNDVGLGNVSNLSPSNLPVSSATATALALKAALASPALTGVPTGPTAATATSNQQLATTAFVHALGAQLVNSAPEALNQLNELAAALGNDPNFSTTVLEAVAGKLAKNANLSDLTDVFAARANLELGIDNDVELKSLTLEGGLNVATQFADVAGELSALDTAIDDVVSAMIAKAFFTAKGQLLTASASGVPALLAPGTNTYTLIANNSTATGLEWVAAFNAAAPPAIGNGTPNTGRFTRLDATNEVVASDVQVGSGGFISWAGSSILKSSSNGVICLWNNSGTGFDRLQWGGTSDAFPALKRSGTGFEVRLADDSGFTDLSAKQIRQFPAASVTPAVNGELIFEATSNTTVTVKLKGSDGTVRSAVLILA